jgi:hypothetical protein
MKRKAFLVMAAVLLAAVFSFDGCKKADVGTGVLTVIVSVGVSGIPAAGANTYNIGDQVAYAFTLDAGYQKLTVTLDGKEIAASGTITVSGNHTLKAYSDENGQFTLTVTLTDGVTGTPAKGTYTYAQGAVVHYNYSLTDGYANLTATLDETAVAAASGTVTMNKASVLAIKADRIYDVRGSWALSESYDDGSLFAVSAVFSGTYEKGTVTDSDGGSGTYALSSGKNIAFLMAFPDVTYEYLGSFSDFDTMSGTCKRYQTSAKVITGTWTATRSTATAAAKPAPMSVSSKKGKG